MRRIPATGLVRGQNGKLIPYRLRPLFYPLPEATGDANQGSILTRLMKAKFTRPTAIPSTKRGMARLLDRIHQDASFVGKMESDPSATGKRYQAVHIQDRSDAAKSLEEMMKAKQPFYVHGANGKVWYFDTKDGNRYSYTDKLDPSDQELVKNFFTTAATTRENPGSSSYGTTEQSGSRFFASPAPARHVIGIESSHAPSWLRKLAETAKSLFRRPSDTTRSMHIV
nr:conserved hypothetical Ustilago-specific protein [Melanopsichium pennsylvanicum 4]